MTGTNDDSGVENMPTREEALKRLSAINNYCEHKLLKGHVKDPLRERVRQGWATVAVSGLKAYLTGLREEVTDDGATREVITYSRTITDDEKSAGNQDI